MEHEQTTIDLWTKLTGRQRVLQFHLANVPMIHLSWNDLDEKQRLLVRIPGEGERDSGVKPNSVPG